MGIREEGMMPRTRSRIHRKAISIIGTLTAKPIVRRSYKGTLMDTMSGMGKLR